MIKEWEELPDTDKAERLSTWKKQAAGADPEHVAQNEAQQQGDSTTEPDAQPEAATEAEATIEAETAPAPKADAAPFPGAEQVAEILGIDSSGLLRVRTVDDVVYECVLIVFFRLSDLNQQGAQRPLDGGRAREDADRALPQLGERAHGASPCHVRGGEHDGPRNGSLRARWRRSSLVRVQSH